MNFATMLASTVTPLADRVPTNSILPSDIQPNQKVVRTRVFNGTPFSPTEANKIKSNITFSRYKEAMSSGEWMATQVVNKKLKRQRMTASVTLNVYRALGVVERRLVGRSRQQGYEWRWLDTGK